MPVKSFLFVVLLSVSLWASADCGQPGTTALQDIAVGETVTVEAVVTGAFPGADGLRGFYLGSESAGIFVYAPQLSAAESPQVNQRWRLDAVAGQYRGRKQLQQVEALQFCGEQILPPELLSFAEGPPAFEPFRDRLVRIDETLTISGNYLLGRYGSLDLALHGRAFAPNSGVQGGELLDLVLDDGRYRRDVRPVPFLDDEGVRRAGDELLSVTGILTHAFGQWRVHPVAPPKFRSSNPRPGPLPGWEGIRAVNFNVENYFIDLGGRGASTEAEFQRQRQRLAKSLRSLDGDVLALHEIQNKPAAVDDLLALLNAGQPLSKQYAAARVERQPAALRSVIFYRPARLTLEAIDQQIDAAHPRDPVAAMLRDENGYVFWVVAAHYKSRSRCPETGDVNLGEGCWAQRRNRQSEAIAEWISPWLDADLPVLILADLNAHAQETAVSHLQATGMTDLLAAYVPAEQRYTYVFRGRAAYLDYALASDNLLNRIDNVRLWPVNADEPFYLVDEGDSVWRASDHDPIVIDLR